MLIVTTAAKEKRRCQGSAVQVTRTYGASDWWQLSVTRT